MQLSPDLTALVLTAKLAAVTTLLLLVITFVLVQAGIDLLRRPLKPKPAPVEGAGDGLDVRAAALTGLGIGVLGGVVGLILGSLRMPALLRWVELIEDRYRAFVAAVHRRGLDAQYDYALEIDSWHILQPLRPFGGAGNWR